MQIKKFEARDMAEALKMIKKEFGNDAVILSAKTIKKPSGLLGALKKSAVEITAATDGQRPPEESTQISEQSAVILSHAARLQSNNLMNARLAEDQMEKEPPPHNSTPPPLFHQRRSEADDAEIVALRLILETQGVALSLCEEIVDDVLRAIPMRYDLTRMRIIKEFYTILEKRIAISPPVLRAIGQPRKIVLLGPTGVGKSTTTARLAAIHSLQKLQPVGLISMDHDRVGAVCVLEKYAKIIGVPFTVVSSQDQLQSALLKYREMAFIFIDTPGLGANEKKRIGKLANQLENVSPDEVHLLMSATTKERDMRDLCEAYKCCSINRLTLTKLDETADFGNLLNLLCQVNIPLAYVIKDLRIPGTIETARPAMIADLILGVAKAEASQDKSHRIMMPYKTSTIDRPMLKDDLYVANKNSDIFHHRSCKSVKKIASDNVQVFKSIAEAEAKKFKPCRMCCPETTNGSSPLKTILPQTATGR